MKILESLSTHEELNMNIKSNTSEYLKNNDK